MDRTMVAQRTALLVREVEDLLDKTITASAELVAHLPAARQEAALSAVFGQQVFERAGSVIGHLMDARRAVVDTHNGCEAVRRKLRIDMGPPDVDKPDEPIAPQIRVISTDKAA